MNAADLVAALDLPAGARVDQRVPKKLLIEHGAPTTADKRRINEGIDEVRWLAALKPSTVGVPPFRDSAREYLEIAVLSVTLRPEARPGRLAELIHRAVPYPLILVAALGHGLELSLAHKRWSQGEAGATVLDGALVAVDVEAEKDDGVRRAFEKALSIANQQRSNMYVLYQGWMDTVAAMLAARVTGTFTSARSPEDAEARRLAIAECARLDAQIATLRAAAAKERQLARQVDLNLQLQRLAAAYVVARANL